MNRKEQFSISHRKIIPHDSDNNGIVHNPSEHLTVSKKPLNKMGIKIISNGHSHFTNSPGQFESKPTTVQNFKRKKVAELIPLVKMPLTPVFVASFGGGRVGGGGTSREALQRAKRKKG